MMIIDLNSDLGERPDQAGRADDAALLQLVTSANIACGGHAGDEQTMRATVLEALCRGVALGAHPGYPDRVNFGRVSIPIGVDSLEASIADQVAALDDVVRACGGELLHVKPHGALYHDAMETPEIAEIVARAAARVRSGLLLVGRAGARGLERWRAAGLPVAAEAFADRRYEPDGSLRPRSRPGTVLSDARSAAAQAVQIAQGRGVLTDCGASVHIRADTLCLHSDTPGALEQARAVRAALEAAGVRVERLKHPRSSGGGPRSQT